MTQVTPYLRHLQHIFKNEGILLGILLEMMFINLKL